MAALYKFYTGEYGRLSRAKGEVLLDTDPFWGSYRALLDECKQRLYGTYTEDERFKYPPPGLYSKVAALYEYCYTTAKMIRSKEHKQRQVGSGGGAGSGGGGGTSTGGGCGGGGNSEDSLDRSAADALIKFPWRMAADLLNEMKRKQVAARRARLRCAGAPFILHG